MGVTTTNNKPFNPRGNDQSPKGFNRAKLYSGKALDFDGVNDKITGTASVLPTGANAFSTCFYVNKDADTNGEMVFWGTRSVNQANGVMLTTGKKVLHTFFGSDLTGNVDIEISKWYFVAVTFDGTTRSIYINGQLDASDTPSSVNVTGTSYQLGYGGAYYHNGELANAKVFNVALTAAQVADLYNNPEKVVPTGVDNTALKLWLPMQEGAGTTAYDGSGNGNHGTISGATYVNGVGAPVSQTAVIDWNKGTNETAYSEEFNSWSTKNDITITDNDATAPDGQETAATITFAASEANARVQNFKAGAFESKTQIVSVWARVTSGTAPFRFKCSHGGVTDYFSNDLTATTEWQRFSFSQTFGSSAGTGVFYGLYNGTDLASRSLEFWGFQLQTDAAALTPYVRTGATAQTTPVLLPQGLTSGRDITGVNLFENVRKQGALNLDGNSYAEVHDNASLDVTTGVSIEAWVDWVSPSASKGILAKWGSSSALYAWLFQARSNSAIRLYIYDGTNYLVESSTLTEGWRHLCATYDGVTLRMYIDGQADTTTAHTGSIPSVQEPVKIGAYGAITSTTYEHDIAQPRIYNRALTAEEVQRNYNAGKNIYTN